MCIRRIPLALLLLLLFFPAAHVPADESPMILIMARPRLWESPNGKTGQRLELAAGARVGIEERLAGDDEGAPWVRVRHENRGGWLPEALLAPLPKPIEKEDLRKIGEEPVDRYHGIPAEYEPHDLIAITGGYEKGRTYELREEAAEAYERMRTAARAAGVKLRVVSAYRSYAVQRNVYLNKLERSGYSQTTVAKPGHSEHQLGTAVDLTDGNEATLLRESFGDSEAGQWLMKNAPNFGFAVSYTRSNQAKTGYSPEPWHYRYYGVEIARQRHREAIGVSEPSSSDAAGR